MFSARLLLVFLNVNKNRQNEKDAWFLEMLGLKQQAVGMAVNAAMFMFIACAQERYVEFWLAAWLQSCTTPNLSFLHFMASQLWHLSQMWTLLHQVRDFLRPFLHGLRGSRSISHREEPVPLHCGCCDGHYHDRLGVYQRWKLWFLRGTGMFSWGFKRPVRGIGGTGHLGGRNQQTVCVIWMDWLTLLKSRWKWFSVIDSWHGHEKGENNKTLLYAFSDRDGLMLQDTNPRNDHCSACISSCKVWQQWSNGMHQRLTGADWACLGRESNLQKPSRLVMFSSVSLWRFAVSLLLRLLRSGIFREKWLSDIQFLGAENFQGK